MKQAKSSKYTQQIPAREYYPPIRRKGKRQGQLRYATYHVHMKIIYAGKPFSNPPDAPAWDDGYHNHFIPIRTCCGREDARNLALIMAYATYPLYPSLEYKAYKVEQISRDKYFSLKPSMSGLITN